ncbi:MAG: hypothetical protein IT487_16645 [Chromatiaceae bacterium]|nr:hypothetical protein [Chromatiaceae bacterium]
MTITIHPTAIVDPGAQIGERLDLPLTGDGQATCPATGQTYRLENGTILTQN